MRTPLVSHSHSSVDHIATLRNIPSHYCSLARDGPPLRLTNSGTSGDGGPTPTTTWLRPPSSPSASVISPARNSVKHVVPFTIFAMIILCPAPNTGWHLPSCTIVHTLMISLPAHAQLWHCRKRSSISTTTWHSPPSSLSASRCTPSPTRRSSSRACF